MITSLPPGYIKVDNYLIRGKHPSIRDLKVLKKLGVNQIYDFRHYSNFGTKFIERFACKFMGIKYKRLACSSLYGDYPGLDTFERVALDVSNNGKSGGITLFHCNSGRHRTAHFAAFYSITGGRPLAEVQRVEKDAYTPRVNKIVKEQVLDIGYFNRKREVYDGRNPIKRFNAICNNKLLDGVHKAHNIFMNIVSLTKDKLPQKSTKNVQDSFLFRLFFSAF